MTATIALIGDPVRHSVSPPMHRAAFAATGVDFDYCVERVTAKELPGRFAELRSVHAGLNVTRPIKEAVLPLLDRLSEVARRAGSVNTVSFHGSTGFGHSTDGDGFLAALRRSGAEPPSRALILGSGGAARAVADALALEGTAVAMTGRNRPALDRLAVDIRMDIVDPSDLAGTVRRAGLIVNATPVGSWPEQDRSPLPDGVVPSPGTLVFDLVYLPRRTKLLERAAAAGCHVIEGIEMLIEQGARSFEIWTHVPAPVEAMRRAAYAALEEAARPGGRMGEGGGA